jgi:hypothetical protein
MRRLSSVILASMLALAACDGDSTTTTTPPADTTDDGPLFSDVGSGGGDPGTPDTSSGGGGNTGATDTSSGGGGNTGATDTSSGGGNTGATDTSSGGGNTGTTDTSSGGGGNTGTTDTSGGGNTGGGTSLCPTIQGCVRDCQNENQGTSCITSCFTEAASDPEADAANLSLQCQDGCMTWPFGESPSPQQADAYYACILEDCLDEETACAQGPAGGAGTCSDLNGCLRGCSDGGCVRACYEGATTAAASDFLALVICATGECGHLAPGPQRDACRQTAVTEGGACYARYTDCFSGGSSGGGTTDPNDMGEGLCQGIVGCYAQCTNATCGNACFEARDNDAEATAAATYLNCPFENNCKAWFGARCTSSSQCPSGWTCTAATNGICKRNTAPTEAELEADRACTSANCSDEWVSCIQGPTGGSGTCASIRPCLSQCQAGDFTCRRTCYKAASSAAVTAYVGHRECVEAECGQLQSDSEYFACDERVSGSGGVCAAVYGACYPSGASASAGGAGGFGSAFFEGPRFREGARFRHYENDFFAP